MVRVGAGLFKGLTLATPKAIRATEGKVRQALFNILTGAVPGARVLDGYAGSGALGIEALSRGAAHVVFVEADTDAVLCIRDNLDRVAQAADCGTWRVVHRDFESALRGLAPVEAPFDLVLLDPPYRTDEAKKALNALVDCAMLARAGVVVIEHDQRTDMPVNLGPLQRSRQHRYGDTVLSLYQEASAESRPGHLP